MTDQESTADDGAQSVDAGSYEVIRARLVEHGRALSGKAAKLNAERKAKFGGQELALVGNERLRTENNCVPRDIVEVGGRLLFGYNVFLGLRTDTKVADVFSLHQFVEKDGQFDLSPIPVEEGDAFLAHPQFIKEFTELYKYYRDTRLSMLRTTDARLLAVFQTGEKETDVRVFRWGLDADERATYVDNRGEREHVFPPSHDFEWTLVTKDDQVRGVHPHVSIQNEVFVECTGGDLTIKVENNTASGQGVYAEHVEDGNQSLDDAQIYWARVGGLILLRILPFRETVWRHLVFNTRTKGVVRIDAIGQACVQLPEGQGIIFPGGYYLQTGETKVFEGSTDGLYFARMIRSPNGEDVLYVFHQRAEGRYVLLPYNLIRKEVQAPIACLGYSLFDDGKMVVARSLSPEPTRVHPVQIWQTPFVSDEFASAAPSDGSQLAKIGNAELVRGISEGYGVVRLIEAATPSRLLYEDLIRSATRVLDQFPWLGHEDVFDLRSTLDAIRKTAELVVDEFEKVLVLRTRADEALTEARAKQADVVRAAMTEGFTQVGDYMQSLDALRQQRGRLVTLKEIRYLDLTARDALEAEIAREFDRVSTAAVQFLLRDDALLPLVKQLDALDAQIAATPKVAELAPLTERVGEVGRGLEVLSEVVGGLQVDDATARTKILEGIGEVFGRLNRVRATLTGRRKELGAKEGRAEFAAQFKLFAQTVTSALALADTVEKTDTQLSRVLVQLEELEGRFSELDEFLGELAKKREEVVEAFGAKRQQLLDERQRRAQNLAGAAERILEGVGRRARSFAGDDELNAYFASDPMVLKVKQISGQLAELGDTVKSDEVAARLKSAQQEAVRSLRDRKDLFDGGSDVLKLGRHRFTVNTRAFELTVVPRDGGMALHLTGTDFYEPIASPEFEAFRDVWEQQLVSESSVVYRAEYLAYQMFHQAERGASPTFTELALAQRESRLVEVVRAFSQDRYEEGYERGLHDADAALILGALLTLRASCGLLRFASRPRALACLFWAFFPDVELGDRWQLRARSLGRLRVQFGDARGSVELAAELQAALAAFLREHEVDTTDAEAQVAGQYLLEELAAPTARFTTSADADALRTYFLEHLDRQNLRAAFEEDLRSLGARLREKHDLVTAWLGAFVAGSTDARVTSRAHALDEAVGIALTDRVLEREVSAALTRTELTGVLGQHPRIADRKLTVAIDELLGRLAHYTLEGAPRFLAFRKLRASLVEAEKARLRVAEFTPKVLTSFVRNRLVDEVYLPLVGDNLAKQLGTVGEGKRTDLMGLLLLISPPGYGKTTLMEYVAAKLGLVFMKVNGPSLGHDVKSLDPAEAPNATARLEVEKINLAFEMGNNVMLYLDDIQHTNPELLQKFISLCDAQRRIEGVWKGRTRTYDMRGKKFCVCMAGNPYTESGAKFRIPDMLANRADTYNLGDVLGGREDVFALSYLENSLTSNRVLAPLAARDPKDVHKLIRRAQGEEVAASDLSHTYSAVELQEIVQVFERLLRVQRVLLKVNLQYIASASMDDAFRTEPPFKLQGSYRNMTKLAEKVVAALNDDELERLIDDHYAGESQTLTTGAEQNLLKLAELRGRMTPEQSARWTEIKKAYSRVQLQGGKDSDPVTRVTGQLGGLGIQLDGIREALVAATKQVGERDASSDDATRLVAALGPHLSRLEAALVALGARGESRGDVEVRVEHETPASVAQLLALQASVVEQAVMPLVRISAEFAQQRGDMETRLAELAQILRGIDAQVRAEASPAVRAALAGGDPGGE